MTGVPADDLKSFFDEARRWDQDRVQAANRSKKLAWTVAAIASGLAVASIAAAISLLAGLSWTKNRVGEVQT